MHVYYIMIKSSQKFWVVYVRYRFIPEQCEISRKLQAFAHSVNGGVSSYLKLGWPLPGGAFYSAHPDHQPVTPLVSDVKNFLAVLSEVKNQYALLFNFDDQKKAKDFQECEQNCGRKTDDFSQGQLSLL